MKIENGMINTMRTAGLALGLAVMLGTAGQANAQYQATGTDGITASPRLRQQLAERQIKQTDNRAAASVSRCEKCRDTLVSSRNTEPKGVGARALTGSTTTTVAKHLCSGCAVEWKMAENGKARHPVAVHKCSASGREDIACCDTKISAEAR